MGNGKKLLLLSIRNTKELLETEDDNHRASQMIFLLSLQR